MPRSFLVKKCKRASPFDSTATASPRKSYQQMINKGHIITTTSSLISNKGDRENTLYRNNQSAFVSLASNCNSDYRKIDENAGVTLTKGINKKSSSSLLIPSSMPLLRFSSLAVRTPQIEPISVIYKEPSTKQRSSSSSPSSVIGKENSYEANQTDDEAVLSPSSSSVTPPPVRGPLSQSTFVCQLCKKVFQAAFSLAQHKCSGIKHVEHRCPECDKVFSCPANLASHRRWHRPRSPGSNRPQKVQKRASTSSTESQAAQKDKETSLENCSNQAKKKRTQHTSSNKEKNGNATKLVKDVEDGEVKDDKDEEGDEERGEEERGGEDESSETSNSSLDPNNNEMRGEDEKMSGTRLTTPSGKHMCEQCGKVFKRPTYLRKHMNYHSNSKPYPCQYCGKAFRSLTNRAKHVLEHAVGVGGNNVSSNNVNCSSVSKTFSCVVCGNRFASKSGLDKHTKTHSVDVFSCHKCSDAFYTMPSLQKHISKVH
eukprot:gene20514-22533_t